MSDLEAHRRRLFSIAYRMLGRAVEAEDMVQETFLRWHRAEPSQIRNEASWLTTTLTRLCIDQLRLARRQREEYVGVWLPEPLLEDRSAPPSEDAALADTLGMAFLLMLETLSPIDRAVFLLREAFGHDYESIAGIVGKSAASCRQIVSRAKVRLARPDDQKSSAHDEAERLVREFVEATRTGEMADLLRLLTEDAVLYSDGGGKVRAALLPIRGADRIARMFIGLRRFHQTAPPPVRWVRINGSLGALIRSGDGSRSAMTLALENGRVKAVFVVRNPDKLGGAHKFE
ncbi:RNA polymerase sigma-70 factor (ECF subfamily) [Haloferula luteola]|uniref:RNA polymerase sigma-70 factor (ECF subfamily) n=1 Tax=Haloferula luteola TaxID=595692 RepID=A0A840VAG3_9BACT|nr:RNA polymerase sigma-70 factor [Haloferula luteola]MBB5350779.1 RNA polymerase sigma-70 factor (ECF subfamily) [Haloferula luteola]